jgi:hypothetical protein
VIRWATERIAAGGVHDALAAEQLRAAGISGILSLDWFPLVAPAGAVEWRRRPLLDGEGNAVDDILDALHQLDALLATCSRVLVHCREGVSRTPFLIACHLERQRGEPVEQLLAELSDRLGYIAVAPGLLATWRGTRADEQTGRRAGELEACRSASLPACQSASVGT